MRGSVKLAFFLIAIAVIIFMETLVGSMVPESKAYSAARDAGYREVKIKDRAIFFVGLRGCDEKDNVRWTVSGVNARGERRTFYVCAGLFKGGTIRSR